MNKRKIAVLICCLALCTGCGFFAGYKTGFFRGAGHENPLTSAENQETSLSGNPEEELEDSAGETADTQDPAAGDSASGNSASGDTASGNSASGDSASDDTAGDTASGDYSMTFVNVIGEEYETIILGSVPKHSYDFTYLDNSGVYYSYSDPTSGTTAILGIDVSRYQGDIDWQQVASSGIQFVIIRLGFRGYGSGSMNLDPMFETYVKGAEAAGLQVGVYFFSQAISSEEALEEADFVLEHIRDYKITGPVVFDTEMVQDDPEARTLGLSGDIFTDCCISFCDRIREAGYRPMIYFNMMWQVFTLDVTRLTGYEKWYADYEAFPQSPYEFSIWQYTESGNVPGIEGGVDLNLWFQRNVTATEDSSNRN